MPVAGRVTGCGRAGRVKEGRYHPRPFPWMRVTGRAGRVDGWGLAVALSSPPLPRLPPPLSPLSPVAGRVTGRAGRVGDWMWPRETRSSPPSPSSLSPVAAGDWSCWPRALPPSPVARRVTGRAGRVGDWRLDVVVLAAGHYHAPPPTSPPSLLSPVAAVLGDWMWS